MSISTNIHIWDFPQLRLYFVIWLAGFATQFLPTSLRQRIDFGFSIGILPRSFRRQLTRWECSWHLQGTSWSLQSHPLIKMSFSLVNIGLFNMNIITRMVEKTLTIGLANIEERQSCPLQNNSWFSMVGMVTIHLRCLSPDQEGKLERQFCSSRRPSQAWARRRRLLWQGCRTQGGWTSRRSVRETSFKKRQKFKSM